jgi:hypothetical protein
VFVVAAVALVLLVVEWMALHRRAPTRATAAHAVASESEYLPLTDAPEGMNGTRASALWASGDVFLTTVWPIRRQSLRIEPGRLKRKDRDRAAACCSSSQKDTVFVVLSRDQLDIGVTCRSCSVMQSRN